MPGEWVGGSPEYLRWCRNGSCVRGIWSPGKRAEEQFRLRFEACERRKVGSVVGILVMNLSTDI